MKMQVVNRKIMVLIFAVMLLIYGVQGISYGQGSTPTVTPGETNTSLKVSFSDFFYAYDVNAYQIQLRKKTPQGDWITACAVVSAGSRSGGNLSDLPVIGIFFLPGSRAGGGNVNFVFTNLDPGTTYEARYRDTNLDECHENPPAPDPWSTIGEGTTHLVTPPRVDFVDVILARAVRRSLKLDTQGEHIELLKIPEAALAKLTELDASRDDTKIVNLTGLEHASQLTKLLLGKHGISDISLLALLTQLTELNLEHNQIHDITPLTQLTQLIGLGLGGNQISDITPLTGLTQLRRLYLGGNQISDITPLTGLTQLTRLYLGGNQIIDIGPLTQLTLTVLGLNNNKIRDITPLSQWTQWEQLTELHLTHNQIGDITPLTHLAGSSVTELDLSHNRIVDVTPLAQLAGSSVTELDLSHNQIRDVAPLAALIQLEDLDLWDNPIENTYPLRALLDANPDLWIDITISKEEVPTLSVSTLQPLTGVTLDGAIVKLTLSSGAFDRVGLVLRNPLMISGIPGIGIARWSEIEHISNREMEIKLTFNGNNITTDSVLTLTVGTDAIANYNGPAYTLQIPVTAVSEAELAELSMALVASTDYPLTAATLNGARVKLTLTSGVYEKYTSDIEDAINVSGIAGVTIHSDWTGDPIIKRVSSTEITFELRFSGTINSDTTLTFAVGPDAIARYTGPSRTAEIPVSASTEVEVTGELEASSAFPLTKATLNSGIVKLTLKNHSYQGTSHDYDEPVVGISGIPGVKTARLRSGNYLHILSSTEIWVELFFRGNLDNDVTLTFTVPPSLIKDYNGPPLAATLPITVKTGKQMLVSEPSRPSMYWINTDTDKIESLDRFDAVTNQVASLTVDTANGKVYWSEHSSSGGVIKRSNLNGTNVEQLVLLSFVPSDIAIDSITDKLYWVNPLQSTIQSANLNGKNIKTIINRNDGVLDIAVDAEGGKLYWADQYSIWRMNLDGTSVETPLSNWGTRQTEGIGGMAIADGKIYWTEHLVWYRASGNIYRANLNGTDVEILASPLGEPVGIAVDTEGSKLYWANSFGGIQRMDINGGEIENVAYGINSLGSLALGTVSMQPTTPTTPETPVTTDAIVSISPASAASPAVGQRLELNLNITGGEAVAGYQASVQFDDTALRYVSGANGDFLPAGAFFVQPVVEGNLVKLNAASLTGEVNGNGTLATLTFEVIAVKESTLTLSDVLLTNSDGKAFVPTVENAEITKLSQLKGDINGDGIVNIQDLVLVAGRLGQTGTNAADVNGDGVVNIQDLVLVAGALGTSAAAPSLNPQLLSTLTALDVKQWLSQAQQLNLTDATSLQGILFLQQLLATLTPKETALLANYPNPFNPETWIPYHLAKDADVTLHIYAVNGILVRTLAIGLQPAGLYQNRARAAYWDGQNEFGETVASGVFFYTLTAGNFTATRKMLILK